MGTLVNKGSGVCVCRNPRTDIVSMPALRQCPARTSFAAKLQPPPFKVRACHDQVAETTMAKFKASSGLFQMAI